MFVWSSYSSQGLKLDQGFGSPKRNGTNGLLLNTYVSKRCVIWHRSEVRGVGFEMSRCRRLSVEAFGVRGSALIRHSPLGEDSFGHFCEGLCGGALLSALQPEQAHAPARRGFGD